MLISGVPKTSYMNRLAVAVWMLWINPAMGVINNGTITWTPNGAVSYSIWRANPGTTSPQLQGVVVTPPYVVTGTIEDGTIWWLKGNYLLDSGQCCKESDLQFIVTPPLTNNVSGTNQLRFLGGSLPALVLQTTWGPGNTWTNLGIFTNAPLQLELRRQQMFRTFNTNLPPLPR